MMKFLKVSGFLLLMIALVVAPVFLLDLGIPFYASYVDTLIIFPFLVSFVLYGIIACIPFYIFRNWLFFQGGRFLAYFSISGLVLIWGGLAVFLLSAYHLSTSLIFTRDMGKIHSYVKRLSDSDMVLSELYELKQTREKLDELCTAFAFDENATYHLVHTYRKGFAVSLHLDYKVFSQYAVGDKKCSDASLAAGKAKRREVQLEQ
jgi:hypothetical protein